MGLHFRRLDPGCYATQLDGAEVGAIVRYEEPSVCHYDVLLRNNSGAEETTGIGI